MIQPTSSMSPLALKRRVNRAVREPGLAFSQGWLDDSGFCLSFFDRCEDLALSDSPQACSLACRAVEMAAANGDGCLVNRSESLLAHAYLSLGEPFWAGRTLKKNRREAFACCAECRSDFLKRQGDVWAEERRPADSLMALNDALAEVGNELTDDRRARILFPRSVAHHFGGRRDRALDDAARVLELMSPESPRGFFLDTAACIAIYVQGGDPCHDERGLALLDAFLARIGNLDWPDARTRCYWVSGQLYARLGRLKRAFELLDVTWPRLLKRGLAREVVAAVLDFAQLKCRPSNLRLDNAAAASRAIRRVLDGRDDLPEDLRQALETLPELLDDRPEYAFDEIGSIRRSFIAPVPGLLSLR